MLVRIVIPLLVVPILAGCLAEQYDQVGVPAWKVGFQWRYSDEGGTYPIVLEVINNDLRSGAPGEAYLVNHIGPTGNHLMEIAHFSLAWYRDHWLDPIRLCGSRFTCDPRSAEIGPGEDVDYHPFLHLPISVPRGRDTTDSWHAVQWTFHGYSVRMDRTVTLSPVDRLLSPFLGDMEAVRVGIHYTLDARHTAASDISALEARFGHAWKESTMILHYAPSLGTIVRSEVRGGYNTTQVLSLGSFLWAPDNPPAVMWLKSYSLEEKPPLSIEEIHTRWGYPREEYTPHPDKGKPVDKPPRIEQFYSRGTGTGKPDANLYFNARDPEGGQLSWKIDAFDDGTIDASGTGGSGSLPFRYPAPGNYTSRLWVSDGKNTVNATADFRLAALPPKKTHQVWGNATLANPLADTKCLANTRDGELHMLAPAEPKWTYDLDPDTGFVVHFYYDQTYLGSGGTTGTVPQGADRFAVCNKSHSAPVTYTMLLVED